MTWRLKLLLVLFLGCTSSAPPPAASDSSAPFAIVLGIAQDGGVPHAGCARDHCERARRDPSLQHLVSSLAIIDPMTGEWWLIDATPDFPRQLARLDGIVPGSRPLDGILLTHAHIGHYTGLMHLGREVMGARGIPVLAMPRMREFLRSNGPWSQLVALGNIRLENLEDGVERRLNERISVVPFRVPHRDEFSETVGFEIRGPGATIVYLPDIDKWERWERSIETVIEEADVLYLDGTFFADGEVEGRSMAEIPHPFISESLARFARLSPDLRAKIRFIHLNHSNPALEQDSAAARSIMDAGMAVAVQGERVPL